MSTATATSGKSKAATKSSGPRYLVKIWFDPKDECFIAEAPALKGCVSHGSTFAEAASNIEEAIDLWIEDASTHGDFIPEPDRAAEELANIRPIISVSKLARRAGINQHTLASKLRRQAAFTESEAHSILVALHTSSVVPVPDNVIVYETKFSHGNVVKPNPPAKLHIKVKDGAWHVKGASTSGKSVMKTHERTGRIRDKVVR